MPAGSLAKASLVGANTVNGSGPDSVSTSPAALTAATSVVWSFELTAFWMMFFDGYIGAPPTLTVFSDMVSAASGGSAGGIATPPRRRSNWSDGRWNDWIWGNPYWLRDEGVLSRQSVPAMAWVWCVIGSEYERLALEFNAGLTALCTLAHGRHSGMKRS